MRRDSHTIRSHLIRAALLALCVNGQLLRAQTTVATPDQDTITADQVRDEMRAVTDSTTLPADVQPKAVELYKQALAELEVAETSRAKANEFRASRARAPDDLDDVKAQLERTSNDADASYSGLALDELQQKAIAAEAARVAAQRDQSDADAEARARSDRFDEVRRLESAAKVALEQVDKQLTALPDASDPADAVGRATHALLLAKRTRIMAERASYDEELPCYEATRELMRARLDLVTRRFKQAEKIERQLKDLVAEKTKVDAEQKARDARWAVLTALPEVMPIAQENERLAELRNAPDGPAARLESIDREVSALNIQRTKIQTEFNHVRKLAELTDSVGLLLQQHRDELPDVPRHRASIRARQTEIANLKLHLIDLESKRSELADIESQAAQITAAIRPVPPDHKLEEVESAVRELLETRRDYLDALIADATRYFNSLVMDLDRSERDLIRETIAYADFINERIFWIRSSPVLSTDDGPRVWNAMVWLGDPPAWRDVGRTLAKDLRVNPVLDVVLIIGALALVVSQRRLRQRLRRIGSETAGGYATSMIPTVRAAVLSVLVAAPVPVVLGLVAWRLSAGWDDPEFCKTVAFGLDATAIVIFATELFRQICRHRGLAELHFGWNLAALSPLRRHLRWLLVVAAPITFV
ncbi:MAG TPA: hypothetical protein VHV77_10450, partial [Pirellulales bacterium]|nr:hypothetical protein [Pirellulales bacterium]